MRRTFVPAMVVAILALTLTGTALWAERGDDSKRLSKNGKAEGVIGSTANWHRLLLNDGAGRRAEAQEEAARLWTRLPAS